MIDIQLLRDDPEKVKKGVTAKGHDANLVDKVLKVDEQYRKLLQEVEVLRADKNKAAKSKDIEKGKLVKAQLAKKEPELEAVEKEFSEALLAIPNLPADDVPEGKGEADNKILREVGESGKKGLDHLELGQKLDVLDFESGAKVAGSGFYYLKNEGAMLEVALVHYGLDFLRNKGYSAMITPDLARERFYVGTGYAPKGPEAQTYTINDSDLGLIATAEVTLAGYHADQVLKKGDLPKKYAGYSHCFRVESGGYGKYSKGLYRVHQFTKVEMYLFCLPEESEKLHQELLALEEEFWKSLEIPYRVVEMCAGDLGAQAAKKYDLEAWMPGRGDWGEVTSTSNTTDYQARRLNIRANMGGANEYVHTLNGTLVATSRAIIAILENFQQEDGTVKIPEVLQKYTSFSEIKSR
ncbi:serine--tRNA ligase [Candidatus Microgenomates bacterium]|nr:serine--tRNA ligase [Candidatus Microgenomates bacterium]